MPMDLAEASALVAGVTNWYHRVPLVDGLVTPGVTDSGTVWTRLGLPDDMRGLRVLDIGTADGYFAFRAERSGADVVAVDVSRRPGFDVCHRVLGSRVEHVVAPVWDLSPARLGTFDIVLFLGVLYHLRDPLAALHLLHDLCRGDLFVETHVSDDRLAGELGMEGEAADRLAQTPVMRFYPGRTLSGDPSNFWGPNHACLVAMIGESGFEVKATSRSADRAYAHCRPVAHPSEDVVQAAASAYRGQTPARTEGTTTAS